MFGFNKRKAAKAGKQAGYDVGEEIIRTVTEHVREKMPSICQWYVDLLITRIREAGDNTELIQLSWEGFEIALQDVPRIVEENIRQQYAPAWEFYKNAGMEHILSGIVRQEAAVFTNALPEKIKAYVTKA